MHENDLDVVGRYDKHEKIYFGNRSVPFTTDAVLLKDGFMQLDL